MSASWPYWPDEGEAFLVDAPARVLDEQSAFIAGVAPCPEDFDEERLWLVYALAGRLQADGSREDLRSQVEMRLRSYPIPSLLALARTRLGPAEAVEEVIHVGLADHALTGHIEAEDTRYLWGRLPVVAALVSGGILGYPYQMPDLADIVAEEHGIAAAEELGGEADPFPSPEGLIDAALVAAELKAGEADQLQHLANVVTQATEVLKQTPYGELAGRIHARPEGAARASAALALAMRADASADGKRRDFRKRYRPAWADLARAMPYLVSLDIIAAQVAISAIDRRVRTEGAK